MRATEERKESRSARFEDARLRRPKDSDLRPRRPAAPEKRRYDDFDEDDYDELFRVKESSETRTPRLTVSSIPKEVSPRPAKHAGETPRRAASVPESEPASAPVSTPPTTPASAPATPPSRPEPASRPASRPEPTVPRMASRPRGFITPKDEDDFRVLESKLDEENCAGLVGFMIDDDGNIIPFNPYRLTRRVNKIVEIVHNHYNPPEKTLRPCEPFWFIPNPDNPDDLSFYERPLSLKTDRDFLRRSYARTIDRARNEDRPTERFCKFLVINPDGTPVAGLDAKYIEAEADEVAAWRAKNPTVK